MKCANCGKEIPKDEAKNIEENGKLPYCSDYCLHSDNFGEPIEKKEGILK